MLKTDDLRAERFPALTDGMCEQLAAYQHSRGAGYKTHAVIHDSALAGSWLQ